MSALFNPKELEQIRKSIFSEEALINYLREMKRKAHGAQKSRHIKRIVEVASTAQCVGAVREPPSLAQAINQRFPDVLCLCFASRNAVYAQGEICQ